MEYQETSKFAIPGTSRFTFTVGVFVHLFQFKNVGTERTCELKMMQALLLDDNFALGEGVFDKMWSFFLTFDSQLWCINGDEEVKKTSVTTKFILRYFTATFFGFCGVSSPDNVKIHKESLFIYYRVCLNDLPYVILRLLIMVFHKSRTINNKIQWNLSKLTTDRSWNSGQHKQVVNLHKCVPK